MLLQKELILNKNDLHIYDLAHLLHAGYTFIDGQTKIEVHEALKILDAKSDVKIQFSCDSGISNNCEKVFYNSIADLHGRNIDIDGKTYCVNCNIKKSMNTKQYKENHKKAWSKMLKNHNKKNCYSKIEEHLNNLFHGELNKRMSRYRLDIYLVQDKLDIEYDGGGHFLSVFAFKTKTIEQLNSDEKERENNLLKKYKIKTIRFIAPHDNLPNDDMLLNLFNEAKMLLNNYNTIRIYLEENNRMECY